MTKRENIQEEEGACMYKGKVPHADLVRSTGQGVCCGARQGGVWLTQYYITRLQTPGDMKM